MAMPWQQATCPTCSTLLSCIRCTRSGLLFGLTCTFFCESMSPLPGCLLSACFLEFSMVAVYRSFFLSLCRRASISCLLVIQLHQHPAGTLLKASLSRISKTHSGVLHSMVIQQARLLSDYICVAPNLCCGAALMWQGALRQRQTTYQSHSWQAWTPQM